MIRMMTLNINGIRAGARKGFFQWLEKQDIDIVCLQEIKAQEEQLTADILNLGEFFEDDVYYT